MNEPSHHRKTTQREIAQALGVSVSTVSRALKDNPRIPEVRRRQIQAAAAEMGYESNPMAVALAQHRQQSHTGPVQACIAWFNLWSPPEGLYTWREFQRYLQGAQEEARRNGYRIEEFAPADGLPMSRLQQILVTRGIRGILLPPAGDQLPGDWGVFDWDAFCVVRFGYSIKHPAFHVVSSDQVTDGIIGYDHIRRLGYRRIGLVRSRHAHTRFVAGVAFQQRRYDEYYDCPELTLRVDDIDQDREMLREWMKRYRPDAVFSGVNNVPELLEEIGYRVPDDVGVGTFSLLDGNADAGIDQRSAEIGEAAVQFLISLMHHNQQGIPGTCRELLIEGAWQDGSTLPPISQLARFGQ